MTVLQVIALIALIIAMAGVISYLLQSGKDTSDEQAEPVQEYTKEELENIKLAEELYNKDLRPIVVKPAPELNVIEPEFIIKEEKVFSEDALINQEPTKPVKKRRKYYPKKAK